MQWLVQAFDKDGPCCTSQADIEVRRHFVAIFDREHAEKCIVEFIQEWYGDDIEDYSEERLLKVARMAMCKGSMRIKESECACGYFLLIDKLIPNSERRSYRDDKLVTSKIFSIGEYLGLSTKAQIIKDLEKIATRDEDVDEIRKWVRELRKKKGMPEYTDDDHDEDQWASSKLLEQLEEQELDKSDEEK